MGREHGQTRACSLTFAGFIRIYQEFEEVKSHTGQVLPPVEIQDIVAPRCTNFGLTARDDDAALDEALSYAN